MAGLRMNSLKSNIFMASIDEYNKQDILNITGFSIGTLPFRYLGIPIAAKRLCAVDYTDLIDNSGGLSIAYHYFVGSKGVWPWKPLLAKSCILPKHRFVLWLIAHSKLMTRDRMGFLPDRSCVLCKDDLETVHHLFFSCKISKIIWNNVCNWLDMRKNMATPNSILTAFRNNYKGTSTLAKMRITALSATVYQVWNLRNRVIFDNETPNVDAIFMKIKIHTYRCVPEATNVLM
ncbi:uncharacterized protein [Primulina huaijiensis]|uniref:uncharacterized protein n=1 Tax=Primulina huaijiensis TaxID=1492673 RepID=UPI003CC6F729